MTWLWHGTSLYVTIRVIRGNTHLQIDYVWLCVPHRSISLCLQIFGGIKMSFCMLIMSFQKQYFQYYHDLLFYIFLFIFEFKNSFHIYEDFVAKNRYLRQWYVITFHNKLWDVINYPCLRYLLLATKSSYICVCVTQPQWVNGLHNSQSVSIQFINVVSPVLATDRICQELYRWLAFCWFHLFT